MEFNPFKCEAITFTRPISAVSVSFERRTTVVLFLSFALFLSEVTVHYLLHGLFNTHLLIHSWCDIARNRVGTENEDDYAIDLPIRGSSNYCVPSLLTFGAMHCGAPRQRWFVDVDA